MIAKPRDAAVVPRKPYVVQMGDGPRRAGKDGHHRDRRGVPRPQIENLSRFEGAGVYYTATAMERSCAGRRGGGRRRGRQFGRPGRGVSVAEREPRAHAGAVGKPGEQHVALLDPPNRREPVHRPADNTEVMALDGDDHLERVCWRSQRRDGQRPGHPSRVRDDRRLPNTHWLEGCVALDAKGFIKTGPDLTARTWLRPMATRAAAAPARDEPAGVFAVGDVRGGSIKRVASAVGEGSIAVAFVHQALTE